MKKTSSLIEIKNLTYMDILKDINITIKKGSFVAISGTNMSGKSTLIKIVATLINSSNTIIYSDKKIEDINKNELFKEIGIIIPEERQIFENPTVEDELFNILENLPIEQSDKIIRYQKVLNLLHIENMLSDNPNSLSGLSYTKLLLASSLLSNIKTLLTDNICVDMTKRERKELLEILKKLNKEEKITIIMSTSSLEEVLDTDYIYILNKGKIEIEGNTLETLKQDNKLNRIGLELPLMIDLSVKLSDYGLLKDIILDMDRMVDTLWK